jgi:DNA modification methylase
VSVRILTGDVRAMLKTLPDESVHCVVTSPPYWGLRDYGVDGQIGLETSLGEHLALLVEVFADVRRVLRKDGTFWLNYGDAYASAPNGRSAADTKAAGNDDRTFRDKPISTVGPILFDSKSSADRGQNGKEK